MYILPCYYTPMERLSGVREADCDAGAMSVLPVALLI
jgi:hypothetical protein